MKELAVDLVLVDVRVDDIEALWLAEAPNLRIAAGTVGLLSGRL